MRRIVISQPELLTPGEAAGVLDISTSHLAHLGSKGFVQPVFLPSGQRRYSRVAIEELLTTYPWRRKRARR